MKLITAIIKPFKLDEVREADILIHVVDISHPQFEDQLNVVKETLAELSVAEKPTLLVFNKVDAYSFIQKEEDDLTPATAENLSLEDLKKTWMNQLAGECVFISAAKRTNIDELRKRLMELVKEVHFRRYPNLLYKPENEQQ